MSPSEVDRDERLMKHEAKYGGPLRRATDAEVKALRNELDAKYFGPAPHDPRPSWARDRLKGAQGD